MCRRHGRWLSCHTQARTIYAKRLGAEHPEVASVDGQLGVIEEQTDPNDPGLCFALIGLARAWTATGDNARAIEAPERCVRLREGAQSDPVELAVARFALARASVTQKRTTALSLATQARQTFATAGAAGVGNTAEIDAWLAQR